ncbi:hypothetical protein LJC61_09095 [Ruminococcaceae bacterium OttesenSCG-928-A16]|nr:hypothetical protein [Ruminococcaceae bacterium OttesenSCG-928-A16]
MESARHASAASQKVFVRFLGAFQIEANGSVIRETTAQRPWNLLQYLIVNRGAPVPKQMLIDTLWPEGESKQPEYALKNLAYRLRSFFSASPLACGSSIIQYNGSSYQLAPNISWSTDYELFEKLALQGMAENTSKSAQLALLRRAVRLYQGDFLANHTHENWVMPLATYYRTLYLRCVETLATFLEKSGLYEEVCRLTGKALALDKYNEPLHTAYLRGLVNQNKHKEAQEHYEWVMSTFEKELGTPPSVEFRSLYYQLSVAAFAAQPNLSAVAAWLQNKTQPAEKAVFCKFDTFLNYCRYAGRTATNNQPSIALLSLSGKKRHTPTKQELEQAPLLLTENLFACLSHNSAFCRLSPSQFLLLLPQTTPEKGKMILSCVQNSFVSGGQFPLLVLELEIQPLKQIMQP